jgi:hypothetical protein
MAADKLNDAMKPAAQKAAPVGNANRMYFQDVFIVDPKLKNSAHTMKETHSGMLYFPRKIVKGRKIIAVIATANQKGIVSFVLTSAM